MQDSSTRRPDENAGKTGSGSRSQEAKPVDGGRVDLSDAPFCPRVSVIIPVYSAAWCLRECLDSIRNLDYPRENLEVLVVDNNSTDDSAAVARDMGFEPLLCKRPGPSAARNRAIEHATGAILACIDSDAVAEPEWLLHLVQPFRDPEVAIVGGRIEHYRFVTGSEMHAAIRELLSQEKHLTGFPCMLPFAATANAAFRASAVIEAGGFDEDFRISEDADLAWRILGPGRRLAYAGKAVVRHRYRSRRIDYFRQVFDYGQGTVQLFKKHRHRFGRRTWIAWDHFWAIFVSALRAPRALLFERHHWLRVEACYDLAAHLSWLAGRIVGSIKYRVLAI